MISRYIAFRIDVDPDKWREFHSDADEGEARVIEDVDYAMGMAQFREAVAGVTPALPAYATVTELSMTEDVVSVVEAATESESSS